MATIKSFTSLEQSRKLAEILPLESADMFYNKEPEDETYPKDIVDTEYPMVIREVHKHLLEEYGIPCWSLAALLGVLPVGTESHKQSDGSISYYYVEIYNNKKYISTKRYDNLVDACYEMIIKLKELNLL